MTPAEWRRWLGTPEATKQIEAMTQAYAAIDEAERVRRDETAQKREQIDPRRI